eukprot:scaffold1040_cov376-Prasinococcus_capsulatus_cf.AAC.7
MDGSTGGGTGSDGCRRPRGRGVCWGAVGGGGAPTIGPRARPVACCSPGPTAARAARQIRSWRAYKGRGGAAPRAHTRRARLSVAGAGTPAAAAARRRATYTLTQRRDCRGEAGQNRAHGRRRVGGDTQRRERECARDRSCGHGSGGLTRGGGSAARRGARSLDWRPSSSSATEEQEERRRRRRRTRRLLLLPVMTRRRTWTPAGRRA